MTLRDLTGLTDDELMDLHARVVRLITLRDARATAETQMANLAATYQQAIGREDGDAWAQPAGAHDAYMAGATVTHGGHTYTSTFDWNVWEPGSLNSGWQIAEDGSAECPAWAVGVTYKVGDLVTHDGHLWSCRIPHASHKGWKPSALTWAVWESV